MPDFKPFSLGEVINSAQTAQFNDLKLQTLRTEIQRKQDLRQMAATSTRPVYGEAEGPPTAEGQAPEIQTGTEYDPEAHQEKLSRAGETEMAAKLQQHMGQMQEDERQDFGFKAANAAKKAITADTPEKWDEMMQEEVRSGRSPQYMPFEHRQQVINMGRKVEDILNPGGKGGSSEFERLSNKLRTTGLTEPEQSRYDVLAGLKARPVGAKFSQAEIDGKTGIFDRTTGEYKLPQTAGLTGSEMRSLRTTEEKQVARVNKATTAMRSEASKGTEHFQSQRIAIRDAIAAMESGDTGLADTLMSQVLSQVQDTNVRAFQMYSEFDRSYGNIAQRTVNSLSRFIGGKRTPEERAEIKQTLLNFKKHADPAARNMRTKYRALARDEGLNPWRVVPPDSPEDVRDAPGIPQAEKLEVLRLYYPEKFTK